MAEFEGIQFEIKGNADAATQSLLRFANALKKVNEAAAQSSKLQDLANALAKIAGINFSGLGDVDKLTSFISTLSKASKAGAGIENLAKSLTTLGNALGKMGNAANILSTFATALERLSRLGRINIPRNLGERLLDIAAAAERISPQALQNLDRLTTYLHRLSGITIPNLGSLIRSLGSAGSSTPKVDTKPLSNVVQMAKKAWGALSQLGKTIVLKIKDSTLGKVTKSIGKVRDMFKSLGRIAYYRAIRSVIKAVTQAFQEGLKNAYLFSKGLSDAVDGRIATALDGLTSNALKMKNQLGAAFGSLLTAIAPAINALIGLVTALATAITQLFAALSGGTFLKAKDVSAEFADNMKAGGGAAKEWKNQLMGFDEINRLEDQNGGGGGGGSKGIDPSDMFEVATVDSAIQNFVDSLKNAIKNGEWNEVGTLLGDKINSIFSNVEVFEKWGEKVGYAINGFVQSIYYALEEIDFVQIGKDLAAFLNKALEQIDFTVLGKLFVRKLTLALDFFIGFLGNVNWGQVGTKVGEFLRGALDKATEWIEKYDWLKVAQNIRDNIIKFIDGLDPDSTKDSLQRFLRTAFDAAFDLIDGLFPEGIVPTLASAVVKLITDAIAEIKTDDFKGAHNVLQYKIDSALFGEGFANWWWSQGDYVGKEMVQGMIDGTESKSGALKRTIGKTYMSPTTSTFNSMNSTVSGQSYQMQMTAQGLIDVFNLLKDSWNNSNLKSSLEDTWSSIKTAFSNGKKDLTTDIDNIKNSIKGFKDAWNGSELKKSFVDTWEGIKKSFSDGKTDLSTDIDNIKEFFSDLPTKFEESKKTLGDKLDELQQKFADWKAPVVEFHAQVKDDSSKWWSNVKSWWNNKVGYVSDFMTEVQDDSAEWWSNVCTWWDNAKTGSLEFTVKVKNQAAEWWNNVKTWWNQNVGQLWTTLGIHLPTIEITWKDWFSAFGHTVQAPEFNIKWNAKGGIVDGATLIGAGEAGKEAIIPLERNTEWISKVASELNEQQSKQSNNIDFASAMEDANDGVISAVFAAATQIVNAIAENSGGGEIDYRSLAKQVSKVQRQMARANG